MTNDDEKRRFFTGFLGSLAAGLVTAMIIRNLTQPPQPPQATYFLEPGEAEQTGSEVGWIAD